MADAEQSTESKLAAWRETKEAEWAVEGSKLRRKHPTREALDTWLDKQCAKSLKLKQESDAAAEDAREGFEAMKNGDAEIAFLLLARAVRVFVTDDII